MAGNVDNSNFIVSANEAYVNHDPRYAIYDTEYDAWMFLRFPEINGLPYPNGWETTFNLRESNKSIGVFKQDDIAIRYAESLMKRTIEKNFAVVTVYPSRIGWLVDEQISMYNYNDIVVDFTHADFFTKRG